MKVKSLDKTLQSRIAALWQEVLPQVQHGSAHPGGSNPAADQALSCTVRAVLSSPSFVSFWVGKDRGPFFLPSVPGVKAALTLSHILEGVAQTLTFGGAPRRPCEIALTLTDGGDFRCPIAVPPVHSLQQLEEILRYGTVFLNTASLHWKALAEICLSATQVLEFPTNINIYVTGPGRRVSTDVHTDNHDVLILQTAGAKHWQVFAPPSRRNCKAHPLYRGKGDDKLEESELGPALLDIILEEGEMLFIPMGFAHATGTVDTNMDTTSVHLTLGISAADYDFCLGGLRRAALLACGLQDSSSTEAMCDVAFWASCAPTPVALLLPHSSRSDQHAKVKFIAEQVHEVMHLCDSQLPLLTSKQHEIIKEVVLRELARQRQLVGAQQAAYDEVAQCGVVFLARAAEDSTSEFRRSVLLHQAEEDARKRQRPAAGDTSFVKRVDPADGVARTKKEMAEHYRWQQGWNGSAVDEYWEECVPLYPDDKPPEDLLQELEAATLDVQSLLAFLRKRTPHLHSDRLQRRSAPAEQLAPEDIHPPFVKTIGDDHRNPQHAAVQRRIGWEQAD